MKLWSCYNVDFIEKKFQDLQAKKSLISIWQLEHNQKQASFQAYIETFNAESCTMVVPDDQKSGYKQLSFNQPLFFHYEKEDIIFKRDIFTLNNKEIKFKMPAEVKFRERRSTERFSYRYQDFKNISFKVETEIKPLSYILTDVSLKGASFVIPSEHRNKVNQGDEVSITGITDQEFEGGLSAKVITVTPFFIPREADSQLLRVGIEFSDELDELIYKSIGSVVEKKKSKIKGLITDKFNGLNDEDYQRVIQKISQENKQLAANIQDNVEEIDRLRYLTPEMKVDFLMEVNHDVLAAAMRLSSKEMIMELLSEVTDNMREEFLEKLDVAKPASAINKAQDQIVKLIKDKEKAGELVLDPQSFVKFV